MINGATHIDLLLKEVPECGEFLYPFLVNAETGRTEYAFTENKTLTGFLDNAETGRTLSQLAENGGCSLSALVSGLERTVNRARQYPCVYAEMRNRLIQPGKVNVAGFVHFLWQGAFISELQSVAEAYHIPLNLNLFPKHEKKTFQNYLALCNSSDDLPDMLIGKGFSSLTTSRFVEKFVNTGCFTHPLEDQKMGLPFLTAGIKDPAQVYHPFAVEELIMVYDKTINPAIPVPGSWGDVLTETYHGAISQMGKSGRDHFGFILMLYLYARYGYAGIERFASNVKMKQHFAKTIKNIGKNHPDIAPVNVMHRFASAFIRSDAREKVRIIDTPEGNPTACHFFLLKANATKQVEKLAGHLFSKRIQSILLACGINPVSANTTVSGQETVQWIGWEALRAFPMPYLKEDLSEVAFEHFKN